MQKVLQNSLDKEFFCCAKNRQKFDKSNTRGYNQYNVYILTVFSCTIKTLRISLFFDLRS